MSAFWLSMVMVFLAELGDKTQLVALSLSCRFNAKVVLAGVFVATLVVHVISVGLGGGMGKILPDAWIQFIAGLAFIGFGLWTLRGDSLDDEGDKSTRKARSPFWIVVITFFLAELGDKTMLSTVSLATDNPIIPVWLGSTLGMVISDGLAILVGQVMGKRLPEKAIKIGASCIFFAFGIYKTVVGGMQLPQITWALAVVVVAGLVYFMLRGGLKESTIPVGCPVPEPSEPVEISEP
ncbi:MAG: TMEM165/GDT1 family protein [Armatimonadota bacterium]